MSHLNDIISSAGWKSDSIKIDLLERIKQINEQIEKNEHAANELKARKKLAKINLDAETPTSLFCAQVAKKN